MINVVLHKLMNIFLLSNKLKCLLGNWLPLAHAFEVCVFFFLIKFEIFCYMNLRKML